MALHVFQIMCRKKRRTLCHRCRTLSFAQRHSQSQQRTRAMQTTRDGAHGLTASQLRSPRPPLLHTHSPMRDGDRLIEFEKDGSSCWGSEVLINMDPDSIHATISLSVFAFASIPKRFFFLRQNRISFCSCHTGRGDQSMHASYLGWCSAHANGK